MLSNSTATLEHPKFTLPTRQPDTKISYHCTDALTLIQGLEFSSRAISMAAQKRIFMTGAGGYAGSVITECAISDGYKVHGLSRSESSDEKLRKLGATPIRGDLSTLDILRNESANADIIIHLATVFKLGNYDDDLPGDIAAFDALAEPLIGTGKPLLVTGGTLNVAPDPTGAEVTETSPENPNPINTRGKFEKYALGFVSKGLHVIAIRLAGHTYGRGGSGVKLFMDIATSEGSVLCIDGGKNHITSVHVDDAARLYLLAAEKGKPGDVFNASSATNVTISEWAETMATALGLPVRNLTAAEATAQFGPFLATYLQAENRASGEKARKELGWQPHGIGLLEEISKGLYTYCG